MHSILPVPTSFIKVVIRASWPVRSTIFLVNQHLRLLVGNLYTVLFVFWNQVRIVQKGICPSNIRICDDSGGFWFCHKINKLLNHTRSQKTPIFGDGYLGQLGIWNWRLTPNKMWCGSLPEISMDELVYQTGYTIWLDLLWTRECTPILAAKNPNFLALFTNNQAWMVQFFSRKLVLYVYSSR